MGFSQSCKDSQRRGETVAASSLFLAQGRASLLHRADEISGVVRAAASLVSRHLRVRAQRARADRSALRIEALPLGSDDLIGRDAIFNPAFERD